MPFAPAGVGAETGQNALMEDTTMQAATLEKPGLEAHAAAGATFRNEPEDETLFRERFDHEPFLFRHSLHRHPAFVLEALLAAAERMNSQMTCKAHFESGEPDRTSWFGVRPEGMTLVDALASIRGGKNWVILKRIHEDAEYGAILRGMLPEISAMTGVDVEEVYYDPTMTIFVTSPGRITPYHMDGETNFLMQVHGTKTAYIYSGNDRSVLSEADLERYWTGKLPKIELPEALPHGHWQFAMEPGNGVFNPATFPHWLQNGDDVSISVSINIKRKRNANIGAYRVNHFLRRAGLAPTAPAQPSKPTAIDRAKEATLGRLYEAAKGLKDKKTDSCLSGDGQMGGTTNS